MVTIMEAAGGAVWAADTPRSTEKVEARRILDAAGVKGGLIVHVGGDRTFYILDEGMIGIADQRLPERWALLCRDADARHEGPDAGGP
jgi:hypothetical protein